MEEGGRVWDEISHQSWFSAFAITCCPSREPVENEECSRWAQLCGRNRSGCSELGVGWGSGPAQRRVC